MHRCFSRFLTFILCFSLLWNDTASAHAASFIGATNPQFQQRSTPSQPADFPVDCSRLDGSTIYLPLITQNNQPRNQTTRSTPQQFGFGDLPPQTAYLGSTYKLTLPVENPNNAPLTFRVDPLPLPANATFDTVAGIFTFTPADEQVGEYTFTFHVTGGNDSDAIAVTITVPTPEPTAEAALCGRILDANAAANGVTRPLEGSDISLSRKTA